MPRGKKNNPKKPEKTKFQHLLDSFIVETPIPKSLHESFPDIHIYQRYNPGLTMFKPEKKLSKDSTFNTKGTLISWTPSTDLSDTRFGIGKIKYDNGIIVEKRVFVKTIHLLNPFTFLEGGYGGGDHNDLDWLPITGGGLEERYKKLHTPYNQAYIDAIGQAIVSRFKEEGMMDNVLDSYGAVIGIKENYYYDITDDFDTLRMKRWFWEAIEYDGDKLRFISETPLDPSLEEELRSFPEDLTDNETCSSISSNDTGATDSSKDDCGDSAASSDSAAASDDSAAASDDSAAASDDSAAISNLSDTISGFSNGIDISLPDLELDSSLMIEDLEAPSSPSADSDFIMDAGSIESDDEKPVLQLKRRSGDNSTTQGSHTTGTQLDMRVQVLCKNMPVLLLFQEAADGTMDELLEEEIEIMDGLLTPSGMKEDMGSCSALEQLVELTRVEKDQRWAAWLAQIVAVLTQLQALIGFCHNDLHTNNIVWTKTVDQFMYYETNGGKVHKIPTYGKKFHIIDFGRATFSLGDKVFVSDDFFEGNDAHGQYNYDVCYNPESPALYPNMSFDLSRLAVSLVDALYDSTPTIRSRVSAPLSSEGSWKKWTTTSDLYNRIWMWMVDKKGRNILEGRDGEERYPGFELYTHIARHMNGAVPKDQWRETPFKNFETDVTPQKTLKLYF